jgi:hypothetical protein
LREGLPHPHGATRDGRGRELLAVFRARDPRRAFLDSRLRWYRRILAVRRERIAPLLPLIRRAGTYQVIADDAVFVSWRCDDGRRLRLFANLRSQHTEFPYGSGRVIWREGPVPIETTLDPHRGAAMITRVMAALLSKPAR